MHLKKFFSQILLILRKIVTLLNLKLNLSHEKNTCNDFSTAFDRSFERLFESFQNKVVFSHRFCLATAWHYADFIQWKQFFEDRKEHKPIVKYTNAWLW